MSQAKSWEGYKSDFSAFGERLIASLEKIGILEKCRSLTIDHACIRLHQSKDVEFLRDELHGAGSMISCADVNGRSIMIFQLTQSLEFGAWKVRGVELPFPKEGHTYEDGWEHVEFVLLGIDNTMSALRDALFAMLENFDQEACEVLYEYKEDNPYAEADQLPNPTISLRVDGIGIKFHAQSIQEVVGTESL